MELLYLFHSTNQIWVVFVPRGNFLHPTNQKHYPDLSSAASSVWNFYACFSDVTSQKNLWWPREMSGFFLRLPVTIN